MGKLNYYAEQSQQLINRLRVENTWWSTSCVAEDIRQMTHRLYLDSFYSQVSDLSLRRAVILMGPRRVGKTVLIFHTIERLIENHVSPQKILYVSIENPIYTHVSLDRLFDLAREAVGKKEESAGFYVFFDEIQSLKEWELHLKSLVDTYRQCKFIASGSAAAALKTKSEESGAGRFTDFLLPPLTFCEYIHLKKLEALIQPAECPWGDRHIACHTTFDPLTLNAHFLNYMNYGGYPEVIFSERIQADPGRYIRNDIVDKVLLRDLPSLYGITDVQELNAFFAFLVYHSGYELSYENLSEGSGVRKEAIKQYLTYLEAAFLIRIIHRIDLSAKRFQRVTRFKVYLTNPALYCALFQPLKVDDDVFGSMVETTVLTQFFPYERAPLGYANWKMGRSQGEVDIVAIDPQKLSPLWATEIKWSDRFVDHPGELQSLLHFMEVNALPEAIVTTLSKTQQCTLQRVKLHFIPTAVYAYTIGWNSLHGTDSCVGL
ncbi:MAG: ATP-binding protein [Kiritimatiellia bacterium]